MNKRPAQNPQSTQRPVDGNGQPDSTVKDPMTHATGDQSGMAGERPTIVEKQRQSFSAAEADRDGAESAVTDDFSAMRRHTATVNGEEVLLSLTVDLTPEEHFRQLRNMTLRDDDVILVAFFKSEAVVAGTHWLWEVLHMLTSGKTDYDSRAKEHLMAEAVGAERLSVMPSPRIINSHLFLRHLSKEIVTKRVRVVHVIRNPKDVAVSHYFHSCQMNYFTDCGFLPFARFFLQGCEIPGSYVDYFAYLCHMDAWQRQHPHLPFINVYFEDMKEKPVECVRELAEFLGVSVGGSACEDIAQACSFPRLKEADVFKDNPVRRSFRGNQPQMYRKGEVGDWKNHFTVALSEQFDDVIARKLKHCRYIHRLRYSL